ncbi:glycosyltransferase family 4 protein [Microbacterium sp. NPDC056003]|uniref:glycosyltransferase family 4 protein n=1 Tax=Microbacterium sp. NPDC056003 TaxID=3345676 RepID=UPI0035D94617
MRGVVHALTPGDHFSPRTGSAIPTVVHGLAQAAASDDGYRHEVLLDASTFHPRYSSATAIEYAGAGYPRKWERAVDLGLSKIGLPRVRAQRSYRPMVTALEGSTERLVIAHNAPILPGMLDATPHVPIYYAHNDLPRGMSRSEAGRALGSVGALIAVSADLADRISSRVPSAVAGRIRVVENGVDTVGFRPREPAGAPASDVVRIMFVGRIVPEKGADVLLKAAGMLARTDVEVVIVGSQGFDAGAALSPYERALRALASEVDGTVRFQPFVDREALPALLQSADIFVAPSRWPEPSGLTVGEAMATGLPVVASDAGGIPSVIGDAGVLVDPGDESALADALRSLIDDEGKRRTIGIAARRRAEDRSWSHSWAQLRTALDEVA